MGALAEGGRAKLRQCQVEQPKPENVAFIVPDDSQAAAQNAFMFAHWFLSSIPIPGVRDSDGAGLIKLPTKPWPGSHIESRRASRSTVCAWAWDSLRPRNCC